LVFKGVLANGIDKQQAISVFAKLFSVTQADAEVRFFTKEIVIKQLTDKKQLITISPNYNKWVL
jgi:hypothetical protein